MKETRRIKSFDPKSGDVVDQVNYLLTSPLASILSHPTFEEDPLIQRGIFLNSKNDPSQHAAIPGFNLNTPFTGLIVFFVGVASITLSPPAFYGEWNTVRSDPSMSARVLQLPS
jgi:hypothetical protein